tara:strand:+ start:313 stop:1269 length:957 start_codon:yes stop_codon:yes gene_type:complete
MALPKQVQAQMAEIEAYEKALEAQQEPHPEELDTEAEVVATIEASPELVEAKPADTSPTDVEEETFKQKYKTLTGKYDAEVPRLHQQVREMTEATKRLQEELKALKVEPTKPKEKVSLVTDADRAEFGEELLDVQRRVAREVSQDYEGRLEQQDAVIQKLEEKLQQTGNQVGEVGFSQRLNQAVPDFPQIDNDERWVSWLNEHDPMLRGPRRVQAQQAFDAGDVEAIAHYVSLWKETLAAPKAAKSNQAELEKQVAPNRSANSVRTQSTTQNSKIYSPKDADRAWNKVRTLNTRGQYAEAEKLEADLSVAYIEGRVRA